MKKYTTVEKVEILADDEQDRIRERVAKTGNTSVRDLSDADRRRVLDTDVSK